MNKPRYKIDNKKIGQRLAKLRNDSGLSQTDLGIKLEELRNGNELIDDADRDLNIKNSISQLERGAKGLTVENAGLYAECFGVSLDYLYCRSDDWKPYNKNIKEVLHLSDKAINNIVDYFNSNNQEGNPSFDLFNLMIENDSFFYIVGKIFEHILMFHIDEFNAVEKSATDDNASEFLADNKNYELWRFSKDMIDVFEHTYDELFENEKTKQSIIELAQLARVEQKSSNRERIYNNTSKGGKII